MFLLLNLPLELFPTTVANADVRSLKSLHTIPKECLYHMLVKFEQNCTGQNNTKFWVFWQKMFFFKFFNHFWQSADPIYEVVSVAFN